MVVTYFDGSWTDHLSIARYELRNGADGFMLRIEVQPRERQGKVRTARQALVDFVAKRQVIHTIQIGKPRFIALLRSKLRTEESSQLGLCLFASGVETLYPVTAFFGPDEVTLNLG